MPIRFPAPWLVGSSSAGQQFMDAFLGARLMKLQRIKQQDEAQRHKEELAIRRETADELKKYRESQAEHAVRRDALDTAKILADADPSGQAAAAYLQSPQMKKMFPGLSGLPPWTNASDISQKLGALQQMMDASSAMGAPMSPEMVQVAAAKLFAGATLPGALFKGGKGGGGAGGAGGEAGAPFFWWPDPQTKLPMAIDPETQQIVPASRLRKTKRGQWIQLPASTKEEAFAKGYDHSDWTKIDQLNATAKRDPAAATAMLQQLNNYWKATGKPTVEMTGEVEHKPWFGQGRMVPQYGPGPTPPVKPTVPIQKGPPLPSGAPVGPQQTSPVKIGNIFE